MTLNIELLRPDDLLNLKIEAENLRLDTSQAGKPVLVLEDPKQPGYLIVTFPPQTVAEQAVYESSPSEATNPESGNPYNSQHPAPSNPSMPMQARIGGASRLVFRIPPGPDVRIPYETASLLDWENYELVVSPLADIPANPTPQERQNAPGISAPTRLETAIELPYRLLISPNHGVAWLNALQAKTFNGLTELWHTRLALRDDQGELHELSRSQPAPLRAIFSPDYSSIKTHTSDFPPFGAADPNWPVLTAMTPSDRHELVVLTSAFHGYIRDINDYRTYLPLPFYAEQLMLSPLGGWLKSRGTWDPPVPFTPSWVLEVPAEAGIAKFNTYVNDLAHLQPVLPKPGGGRRRRTAEETAVEKLMASLPGITEEKDKIVRPDANTAADVQIVGVAGLDLSAVIWPQLVGTKGDPLNLEEWDHIATQGRDHYVRIVYQGHLYPFGHRASLVKVTQRKIRDVPVQGGGTTPLAYLVQHMYIVVRQPLRRYDVPEVINSLQHGGREMPLKSIRLTTLITPDIAQPLGGSHITGTDYSFWVRLGSGSSCADDFKFHAIAEDLNGNRIDLTASLVFVLAGEGKLGLVVAGYNQSGEERACLVPGQTVTYAPPASGGANQNTSLTTNRLYFETQDGPPGKEYGGFLPKLYMADVKLPAVEAMLGQPAETKIAYEASYLNQSANNTTGLFAKIVEETASHVQQNVKLISEFSAKQAGGFATPNLAISGLTSQYGPLAGDLANAAQDVFDPSDFFNDVKDSAKLFGALSLTDLLKPLSMGAGAPKIQFDHKKLADPPPSLKEQLTVTLDWTPEVQDKNFGIIAFHDKRTVNGPAAKLEVHGKVQKTLELPPSGTPDPGHAEMNGSLTDFRIELLHVVEVLFVKFAFSAVTGKKLSVTVELDPDNPVQFEEDLQFVERLREAIPPGLFGDGASLDINATRVKAGFSLGLPPLSVGVFSLKDVIFAAFIELPFVDGKPLFDFSFSSREHPFNLTVMIFGGGGFFHMQIDTLGVKMLEAALEFGASASIDLGVASGSVHIMAGIYFSLQRKHIGNEDVDVATLGGYLRMGGELSVLGLISVSLEFYLILAYETPDAYGRATLTVKVEVLFFSASVDITVEKRFGGSPGDPTFLDGFTTPAVWNEYAGAFA
jgi:hypothetical protein